MTPKILVTGVSGYLGSAIAERLVRAGYEVLGLTRDEAAAARASRTGIHPVVGDLTKPETFAGPLKNVDAAVHAAIALEGSPASLDQRALEAFAHAAEDGRLRRLLYTSGFWVHGDTGTETRDESATLQPLEVSAWRAAHEEVVMDLATHEVVPVVFRPAIVYGESRGIVCEWFREARDHGTVTYCGDGSQHWSMVHRDDVAEAYRLGLEHASSGDRFLLADGSAHTVREMAEAVARVTGATAQGQAADEVVRVLGPYGQALLSSCQVSAAKARRELGWVPRHTSFVSEVESLYREWLGPREAQVS